MIHIRKNEIYYFFYEMRKKLKHFYFFKISEVYGMRNRQQKFKTSHKGMLTTSPQLLSLYLLILNETRFTMSSVCILESKKPDLPPEHVPFASVNSCYVLSWIHLYWQLFSTRLQILLYWSRREKALKSRHFIWRNRTV